MSASDGHILPYGVFRADLKIRGQDSAVATWAWSTVLENLDRSMDAELPGMALIALSRNQHLAGCETVPGLSLSVQCLAPARKTPHHAHAWWHVYVVQAGSGLLLWGNEAAGRTLSPGDVSFIPGWQPHSLENNGTKDFITLNLSNMAQQADLANFRSG
jgi:gentisate 1,2-dioxygenase